MGSIWAFDSFMGSLTAFRISTLPSSRFFPLSESDRGIDPFLKISDCE